MFVSGSPYAVKLAMIHCCRFMTSCVNGLVVTDHLFFITDSDNKLVINTHQESFNMDYLSQTFQPCITQTHNGLAQQRQSAVISHDG